jgi:HlyD family secretion protein
MIIKLFVKILVIALVVSCSKKIDPQSLIKKDVVKMVTLKDVIEQTGEVQPIIKIELKSEASGQIDTIYVKEGERLKMGQRILKIDPTQLLSRKAKLELSLERAKINLAQATRDVSNVEALVNTGTVSRQKADDARSAESLAQINVKDIELEMKDLDYQLGKTTILAPMNGVLTALTVEKGEIAISATQSFSGGTAIGTIADLSKLEILTKVGEADYPRIKEGQKVSIRLESDRLRTTTGVVSFVAVAAKKETGSEIGQFEVRVNIDSVITGLVPGVNVTSSFVVLEKKNVLAIPFLFATSLPEGGYYVSRSSNANIPDSLLIKKPMDKDPSKRQFAREGKIDKRLDKAKDERRKAFRALGLKRQRVSLGETDFTNYEVTGGLNEGDTVLVLLGNDEPRPGR